MATNPRPAATQAFRSRTLPLRRVEFGEGRYRVSTFGVAREFTADDVALVVDVEALGSAVASARAVFAHAAPGRALLRLSGREWMPEQLDAIVADLVARGAPLDRLDGRVATDELEARHPGILHPFERNPGALVGVVLGAALLAALLLVFLVRVA